MNNLLRKLKGYQKAHRARFLLLKEGRLTQEEFLLYELGVAITDWDRKHETYGTFKATNQEIAEILGWHSDTTALKHKKSLIRKGIFIVTEDGRIRVKGFEKWQLRKTDVAENEELAAKNQVDTAKTENKPAKIEEDQIQSRDYPLVSSKVNLGLSQVEEYVPDKEIDEIIKNIDSQQLSSLLSAKSKIMGITNIGNKDDQLPF